MSTTKKYSWKTEMARSGSIARGQVGDVVTVLALVALGSLAIVGVAKWAKRRAGQTP